MIGRENLDFARRTLSAQIIVAMSAWEGHTWQDRPRGRSPAEFFFTAAYGRSNCDQREKSSFSTQSVDSRRRSDVSNAQIADIPWRRGGRVT
jgi:hypothetical protein